MYSSTSTVKKFEQEYFYKFSKRKLEQLKVCRKNINDTFFQCLGCWEGASIYLRVLLAVVCYQKFILFVSLVLYNIIIVGIFILLSRESDEALYELA